MQQILKIKKKFFEKKNVKNLKIFIYQRRIKMKCSIDKMAIMNTINQKLNIIKLRSKSFTLFILVKKLLDFFSLKTY